MNGINWAQHLVLALTVFSLAWLVVTQLKLKYRLIAISVIGVSALLVAAYFSLWAGLLGGAALCLVARWVYHQSRAIVPADLYRWL